MIWTWPAVTGLHLLGHHPDGPGTAWFLSASSRLLSNGWLDDPLTGWPAGAHYGRPDSFLQLPLGALLGGLGAARLLSWLTVAGVAVSAWAAERFARELGARAPWSLLAGLAFALSGLASTALLEGYPYQLVNPWMPLFATAWLRATRVGGRPQDGLWAGTWFVLTLLTTAWLGIASIPIAVGFAIPALKAARHSADRLWPLAAAALTVALPGLLYALAFSAGGGGGTEDLTTAGFPTPDLGLTLRRFLPPGPSIDLHGYSQSAALPAVAVALTVAAPRVLDDDSTGWRRVAFTGAAALVFALVPVLAAAVLSPQGAILQDGIASVIIAAFMRFPDRLSWATLLCLGAVGAVVLSRLAERRPRSAALLLALSMVDAFVVPRLPWRQRTMQTDVPSAYAAHSGPVLDVWPQNSSRAPAWDLWTTNLGCYYQTVHQRPIADLCLVSPGQVSPRSVLQDYTIAGLLDDQAPRVAQTLTRLGFGSVVLHAGMFQESDQEHLLRALQVLGTPLESSTDGGEWVVSVGLNPSTSNRPEHVRRLWNAWLAKCIDDVAPGRKRPRQLGGLCQSLDDDVPADHSEGVPTPSELQ